MSTTTITLRTIRKIARKYDLTWHQQGGGWVINGAQQHYSHGANTAGEKSALVDYMATWGQHAMSGDDYNTVRDAQAQIRS